MPSQNYSMMASLAVLQFLLHALLVLDLDSLGDTLYLRAPAPKGLNTMTRGAGCPRKPEGSLEQLAPFVKVEPPWGPLGLLL